MKAMHGKVNCQRYGNSYMKNISNERIPRSIQKMKLIRNIKDKTYPSNEKARNVNIVAKTVKQENTRVL